MAPARPAKSPSVLTPSAELGAVIGFEPLPRAEIVRRVWSYVRENGLQDPRDRRIIVADAALTAVFGRERVSMLSMMGLLAPHLRRGGEHHAAPRR